MFWLIHVSELPESNKMSMGTDEDTDWIARQTATASGILSTLVLGLGSAGTDAFVVLVSSLSFADVGDVDVGAVEGVVDGAGAETSTPWPSFLSSSLSATKTSASFQKP